MRKSIIQFIRSILDINIKMVRFFIGEILMRYTYLLIFWVSLFCTLMMDCSGGDSQTNEIFLAEKMFYKAEKMKENILTNPDITSPEEFQNAEMAYREIINKFGNQKNVQNETKQILRKSWLTVAELFQLQKRFDTAIKVYREIIEKSASDRELRAIAQFSIARSYEQSKQLNQAIESYQYVFKNYPPVLSDTLLPNYSILETPVHVARLYLLQGNNQLADQQYSEARRYYEAVINKYLDSEIALAAENQIAICYGDQGMWQNSAEVLNNIIVKYSGKKEIPNVIFNLGQLYQLHLNRFDKALEVYQRVIQQFPQNPNLGKAHLAIGEIYFSQKSYDKARHEFKYVIDKYRDDQNSCISAQMAIAQSYELENNWNKALNEYQWVINNYPNSIQSLNIPLYIANHYEKELNNNLAKSAYESGVKQYQQLIETFPNTVLAGLALDYAAASYIRLERWNEAALTFESLLAKQLPAQKKINAFLTLENIYEEKLNDTERAIETYAKLLEQLPEIPNVSMIKGKVQQLQQKLDYYKKTNKPPYASEIIMANPLSTSSVAIQWNQNNEDDFLNYKLIRSDKPGVDLGGKTIAEIATRQQTQFVDNNVKEGRTYYYRLFTFDKGSLNSASKEVSLKVEAKEIVATINLQVRSDSWASVFLVWNRYTGNDFDSYKIYRSITPGVSLNSQLVKTIFDQQNTQVADNVLKENTTYYYKAYVYNSDGANKPSNEVQVTTQTNVPPRSIILNNPVKSDRSIIELSWAPSNDSDFSMYRIFRAERSPVSLDRTAIWMNSNQSTNKYKDTGLISGKTYYYKIVVYDKGGLFSESNEVSVTP